MNKKVFILILIVLSAFLFGHYTVNKPGQEKVNASQGNPAAHVKKQLYTCGMHPQVIQDHPGDCPICGMTLTPVKNTDSKLPQKAGKGEHKILYWRAPMDPTFISQKPGKSPMGMDLVPVYDDEVSSGDITISSAVEQNIGITTADVQSGPLFRAIKTYGTSTWNETTLSAINTKIDGWIEKLYVNETGQRVRKGQRLLSIYSPKLVATQREYLVALDTARALRKSSDKTVAQGGKELLESARRRLNLWDISARQIENLEKTRKVQKELILYAPSGGIVIHRAVVAGDYVKAGMNLIKIASLDPIWVIGSIYESDIPVVKKGMKAKITFDNLPGESFDGRVDYVYPYVEGASRTGKVRIVIPNKDGKILPEMYASVSFFVQLSPDTLQIPSNAVIRASTDDTLVFIAKGGGKFEGRKVILGPEGDGHRVMVKAGLAAGEKVVTSAQFLLDSESNLKAAIQSMLDSQGRGGSK
ncbi:MAG: efflux RND transporter periplasmic adaptor subunit [Acidobacteria bacterium]|nr:efflux RND transporter periplasmic adaptor subunit [Acidobacteriota bacterium]